RPPRAGPTPGPAQAAAGPPTAGELRRDDARHIITRPHGGQRDRGAVRHRDQSSAGESGRIDRLVECQGDGPSRAMLYDLAFATGLRRKELASLGPASFDLDAGTGTVAASNSKRRRQDVQPLPPAIAGRLRAWLAAENVQLVYSAG
ncbi:hypothetical protein B4Q13_22395, partial [Lacticaseibacillus rhamnosus]